MRNRPCRTISKVWRAASWRSPPWSIFRERHRRRSSGPATEFPATSDFVMSGGKPSSAEYERRRKRDNEYRRKRYAKNAEYRARILAAAHRYYAAHKTEICTRSRLRWAIDPEFRARVLVYQSKYRRTYLLRRYGITLEEYDRLLALQNGVCAICEQKPKGRRFLCVDHCHRTGRVRGLLCTRCNVAIGLFEDNPEYTEATTVYLRAARERERTGHGLPPARRTRARRKQMRRHGATAKPKAAKPAGSGRALGANRRRRYQRFDHAPPDSHPRHRSRTAPHRLGPGGERRQPAAVRRLRIAR